MKNIHLIHIGLLSVLLFWACTREENEPLFDSGTFALEINDGGFLSVETAGTRAAESGYQTTFTAGDKVGLIVTNQLGTVVTDNKPFTYNGTKWMADAGDMEKYVSGYQYLVYYPYSAAMNGKRTKEEIIAASTPPQDQRNYADYTASDLMIGTDGSFNSAGSVLQIALKHVHTLLVLDSQYTYSDTNGKTYKWRKDDVITGGFTIGEKVYVSWKDKECAMRVVVPTSELAQSSSIRYNYTYRTIKKTGAATVSAGQAGCYQPITTEDSYTLVLSAIYYADGTTLPFEARYSESEPIGIVLKVGKDDSGDWVDDCDYKLKDGTTSMPTIRGYVLALYDANNGSTCTWGLTNVAVGTNTGFYGYKNTNTIKAYATKYKKNLKDNFPATYHATAGYEADHPAPDNSSGWFLPSGGQGNYWLNNKNVILESVRKATGKSDYKWKDKYWSSSEYDSNLVGYAWIVNFYGGYVDNDYKFSGNYVRGVFAF